METFCELKDGALLISGIANLQMALKNKPLFQRKKRFKNIFDQY